MGFFLSEKKLGIAPIADLYIETNRKEKDLEVFDDGSVRCTRSRHCHVLSVNQKEAFGLLFLPKKKTAEAVFGLECRSQIVHFFNS